MRSVVRIRSVYRVHVAPSRTGIARAAAANECTVGQPLQMHGGSAAPDDSRQMNEMDDGLMAATSRALDPYSMVILAADIAAA